MWWVCCLLAGCAPSGSGAAIFSLKNVGSGPDLMTRQAFGPDARWTFIVDEGTGPSGQTISDAYFEGEVDVNGVRCGRYVTDLQVVYLEQTPDGLYNWGSSDGDIYPTPFTLVSYPLRLDREWYSGNEKYPKWYRYLVSAVEPIQTPAGLFQAARVDQLNTRTQERVSRWYVQNIGLVQRFGYSDLSSDIVSTTLLRFNREGSSK